MISWNFANFRLSCALCYLADALWDMYLSKRQLDVLNSFDKAPNAIASYMDESKFLKAKQYGIRKRKFELLYGAFGSIFEVILIYFNGFAWIWNACEPMTNRIFGRSGEILVTNAFLVTIIVSTIILSLPFKLYFHFVVEAEFGFNKMSLKEFFKDMIKKYCLLTCIALPLISGLIKIILWKGDRFFIFAALFVIASSVALSLVYPDFIAPLMDEFIQMEECPLKSAISKLVKHAGFPDFKVFVVKGSKKSAHSNAYFIGLFKTRRIVLYDTLVGHLLPSQINSDNSTNSSSSSIREEGIMKDNENSTTLMTEQEVLAVLAHELGHWQYGHIYKLMLIGFVQVFTNFYAYSLMYKWPFMFKAFGFHQSKPIIIGMLIVFGILMKPIDKIEEILSLLLSRYFERQADMYAVLTHGQQSLRASLIKLYAHNLDYPYYDWLYSVCTFNHPPLLERLAYIGHSSSLTVGKAVRCENKSD